MAILDFTLRLLHLPPDLTFSFFLSPKVKAEQIVSVSICHESYACTELSQSQVIVVPDCRFW